MALRENRAEHSSTPAGRAGLARHAAEARHNVKALLQRVRRRERQYVMWSRVFDATANGHRLTFKACKTGSEQTCRCQTRPVGNILGGEQSWWRKHVSCYATDAVLCPDFHSGCDSLVNCLHLLMCCALHLLDAPCQGGRQLEVVKLVRMFVSDDVFCHAGAAPGGGLPAGRRAAACGAPSAARTRVAARAAAGRVPGSPGAAAAARSSHRCEVPFLPALLSEDVICRAGV